MSTKRCQTPTEDLHSDRGDTTYLESVSQSVVKGIGVCQDENCNEEQYSILECDVLGDSFHALDAGAGFADKLDVLKGIGRGGFVSRGGFASLCSLEVAIHIDTRVSLLPISQYSTKDGLLMKLSGK